MEIVERLVKLPDDLFEHVMSFYEKDEQCYVLYYILNSFKNYLQPYYKDICTLNFNIKIIIN